jgi:uncharacterized protein (DUF1330 family)
MPAYFIAQLQIHDRETYREYATKVGPTVAGYGGRLLVATSKVEVMEGELAHRRTVIGEFPSLEQARAWYESAEYQAIAPLRRASTTGPVFIVEGFERGVAGS